MRHLRTFYAASIRSFLQQSTREILGIIQANMATAETVIQQINTWQQEIHILKEQLGAFGSGRIIFEYTIPRMGKRVDVIVLFNNIVFLLEFKCGDHEYRSHTHDHIINIS